MRTTPIVIVVLLTLIACAENVVPPQEEPEPTPIPEQAIELDPAGLVAGLPWTFEVTEAETADETEVPGQVVFLVSKEARSASENPPVHLRARFATEVFADPVAAAEAFDGMAAEADPDTGLSYAWDLVMLHGSRLYHLHGDCTLSADVFEAMGENLGRLLIEADAEAQRVLKCRCGGGCETS